MTIKKLALGLAAAAALVGCEDKKPAPQAPPPTAAAPAPSAAPAPAGEAAKKEEIEAPDTHGMPGMSELFKDKDKKEPEKK
jgi:uncharacterized lipoprotein YbaY